jgi:hypothetical protein
MPESSLRQQQSDFLRLVEADETKLLPGETKIQLLHRKGNSG